MQYVYCAVGTVAFHIVQVTSSLEGVNSIQNKSGQSHTPFSCQYHYTIIRTNLHLCTTHMRRRRVNHSKVSGKTGEKSTFTEKLITSLPFMKGNTDVIAIELVFTQSTIRQYIRTVTWQNWVVNKLRGWCEKYLKNLVYHTTWNKIWVSVILKRIKQ